MSLVPSFGETLDRHCDWQAHHLLRQRLLPRAMHPAFTLPLEAHDETPSILRVRSEEAEHNVDACLTCDRSCYSQARHADGRMGGSLVPGRPLFIGLETQVPTPFYKNFQWKRDICLGVWGALGRLQVWWRRECEDQETVRVLPVCLVLFTKSPISPFHSWRIVN